MESPGRSAPPRFQSWVDDHPGSWSRLCTRLGLGAILAVLAAVVAFGLADLGVLAGLPTVSSAATDPNSVRTVASACPSPRPPVQTDVSQSSPTTLGVTVTAGSGTLQSITFGAAANAQIEVPGRPPSATGGFSVSYPAGTQSASFTVRKGPTSAATTVRMTVRDGCGDWPTFVGGGTEIWSPATATPTATTLPAATATATATNTATATATATTAATATNTSVPTGGGTILEGFEGAANTWQVVTDTAGSGTVQRSSAVTPAQGSFEARLATTSTNSRANVRLGFTDAAADHQWEERPGTWHWQRASVYVPAATVNALGTGQYLTIGRLWASGAGYGWLLRVKQNGELYVVGRRDFDNAAIEFKVYGQIPTDRWFDLELGLHSQAGPGVKRAFAFLIDGAFYGWYHQGRMQGETYDQAAIGIVETNSTSPLELYVDNWRPQTTASLPGGPDTRSVANVQESDYRLQSGQQWQIDWTTWANDLRLVATHGLYSASDRLQSGRNLDRLPDITSGWAEIEVGWPSGAPADKAPSDGTYFGPMVGFRKEINREQNLEVIPIGRGNGNVSLVFEIWDGNGPTILGEWPMPLASIGGGSHIPEPGDVIRARWDQLNATQIRVRASYYDASAAQWSANILDVTFNGSTASVVDFNDGFHLASSITIDTTAYSIRRYKVGVPATYPGP
ncbi:MAG: hypothetical protein U0893_26585 [Chloroflexota bacterium]